MRQPPSGRPRNLARNEARRRHRCSARRRSASAPPQPESALGTSSRRPPSGWRMLGESYRAGELVQPAPSHSTANIGKRKSVAYGLFPASTNRTWRSGAEAPALLLAKALRCSASKPTRALQRAQEADHESEGHARAASVLCSLTGWRHSDTHVAGARRELSFRIARVPPTTRDRLRPSSAAGSPKSSADCTLGRQ